MPITFPSNTTEIIDEIRSVIGRPVDFYSQVTVDCPTCEIDPISGNSLDSFCPTCSGVGSLVSWNVTTISGHVTHAPIFGIQWNAGGQYFDGDCVVQIKYNISNLATIENADYILVDGVKFDIRKRIYRGVPQLNRIILNTIQRP